MARGIIPTYQMAIAAGRDAGNRSAKKAGRDIWCEEDWNAAAEAFNRVQDVTRNASAGGVCEQPSNSH